MPTKVCRDCLVELPLDAFDKHPNAKQGRRPECKPCRSIRRGHKRRKSVMERFLSYAIRQECPDACWDWSSDKNEQGYGQIWYQGKTIGAHVLSYILYHGPVPEGKIICHSCDNPPCANPRHLWAGTYKENMEDAMRKGRLTKGKGFFLNRYGTWRQGASNGRAKLTDALVHTIKTMLQSHTATEVARTLDLDRGLIYNIKNGHTWRHITI